MAKIEDWFDEFATRLMDRSFRNDWPTLGTDYWLDFERSLKRLRVTYAQAEEALSLVCDKPGLFSADWRPAVVEEARKIKQRDDEAGLVGDATGRAAIEKAARDCPECGGAGSSSRFVHRDDHPEHPRGHRLVGICGSCDYGRFLAAANGRWSWADHPELSYRPGLKYLHHPDDWDEQAGRPRELPDSPAVAAYLRGVRAGKGPGSLARPLADRFKDNERHGAGDSPVGPPGPSPPAPPPGRSWRQDPPAGPPGPAPRRSRERPVGDHSVGGPNDPPARGGGPG